MSNTGLPGSKIVCLYSIPEFAYVIKKIKEIFDAKGGYDTTNFNSNADVEALRNLPKCSVFIFATHAGTVGDQPYCMLTASLSADHAPSRHITHWNGSAWITDSFVRDHWRFEKDSFVMLHCCDSMNDSISGGVREIMKTVCNASAYGGWTNRCTGEAADDVLWRLFDLMLGANKLPYIDQSLQPQRSFPLDDVMKYLRDSRHNPVKYTDKNIWSELRVESYGNGDFGLLAPSIHHLEIDEETRKLTLIGIFDQQPLRTKVFVKECQTGDLPGDAYELEVESSTDSEIVCANLPQNGRGAAGYVVVALDLGADKLLQSNPAPMTMWEGTFTYKIKKPDASASTGQCEDTTIGTITADVSIRGDVHKVRERPGGPVQLRPSGCDTIRDSSKLPRYESRGSHKGTDPKYSYEWSGSGSLLPGYTEGGKGFAKVNIWYAEPRPKLLVNLLTAWGEAVLTIRNEKDEILITDAPAPINIAYLARAANGDQLYMLDFLQPSSIESSLRWDPGYDIPASAPICRPIDYPLASNDKGFTAELSWTTLKAQYPPDENTPA